MRAARRLLLLRRPPPRPLAGAPYNAVAGEAAAAEVRQGPSSELRAQCALGPRADGSDTGRLAAVGPNGALGGSRALWQQGG